ncbi:hypothetical protein [Paenibacillus sp.]|uniref:hypothetical protein n=1 Tax=Paenibacillus sp. TaxID=58172 RepID=UPI002D2EE962|nr:hypothetical protein [Paenibacillus sp.]HZG55525.1 hypothetical protein [Paenibacillus sp.]
MGNTFFLYGSIAVVGVTLIGFLATLWIGASRENNEGNPAYDRNSVPNWIRLSVIYALTTALAIGALIWFVRG